MRSAETATYANRGKAFQKLIKASAEDLVDRGLHLDQTSQGFQATGRTADGQVVGRATTVGPLDFAGIYARPQRWAVHVEFDAKASAKPSLDLSKLPRHQVQRLRRLHDARAVAFLLVGFYEGDRVDAYALTWPVLEPHLRAYRAAKDYGVGRAPASLKRSVIEAHCPRVSRSVRGRLDLVAVIEQLMAARAA
jgi:penicillin-binding protein-related factor A (putative recombinase)